MTAKYQQNQHDNRGLTGLTCGKTVKKKTYSQGISIFNDMAVLLNLCITNK